MNFPRISIVIPSYNQGRFLEETIHSVVDQQYPDLELFVVDGDSKDNSVDIIKNHPLMPKDVPVHGLVIDPKTGKLDLIVDGNKN